MTNSEQQLVDACIDEPSLVFSMIRKGHYEVIEKLISDNEINVNLVDNVGNDVVTRLLKAHQYDLVEQLMKKRNWDVNHKNVEGNTFAHVLANDNTASAVKIVEQLNKKKNYSPNIENNKGETILDRAINSNYLCTIFKILEDERFNNIGILSFKNLYNFCIKNRAYGKYSKVNNLEIIVESLEKKKLDPSMASLIQNISNNIDTIKKDLMNNKSNMLESLIDSHLVVN